MKPEIFKGCQVQYSYDKNEQIYSVRATLNGRPRILTLRVGADFTEFSLADIGGKLLEVLREKGGSVTFEEMKR